MQEWLEGTAAGSRKANRGRWHNPGSFHYEVFRIILQSEVLAAKSHWAVSRSLREGGRWEGWIRSKHEKEIRRPPRQMLAISQFCQGPVCSQNKRLIWRGPQKRLPGRSAKYTGRPRPLACLPLVPAGRQHWGSAARSTGGDHYRETSSFPASSFKVSRRLTYEMMECEELS